MVRTTEGEEEKKGNTKPKVKIQQKEQKKNAEICENVAESFKRPQRYI